MRRTAYGEPWTMPATIDDPVILDEIKQTPSASGSCRPLTLPSLMRSEGEGRKPS